MCPAETRHLWGFTCLICTQRVIPVTLGKALCTWNELTFETHLEQQVAYCGYQIRVPRYFTLRWKVDDVELLRKLAALGESVRDGFTKNKDCQLGLAVIHCKQCFQPSQQVSGVAILGAGMQVSSENTCPPSPQPDT